MLAVRFINCLNSSAQQLTQQSINFEIQTAHLPAKLQQIVLV